MAFWDRFTSKAPQKADPAPRNEKLVSIMAAGAKDAQASREPLYRALLDAHLLIPQREPIPAENYVDGKLIAGTQIKFLTDQLQGKKTTPCFTDLDAMRAFDTTSEHWIAMPTQKFCAAALTCGFEAILIHGPSIRYLMSQSEIQALAEGVIPLGDNIVETATETRIRIGMPAERFPDEVLGQMRAAAASSGVGEVYWFWLAIGDGPAHLGIASAEPRDEKTNHLGEAIHRIWSTYRGSNSEVTRLELDDMIRGRGELLYRSGA